MTDLVERLREYNKTSDFDCLIISDMLEAAAEIERLRNLIREFREVSDRIEHLVIEGVGREVEA